MKKIVVLGLLVGCGPNIWSANVITDAMTGCKSAGGSEAYCTCMQTEMQKLVVLEDWLRFDLQVRTNQPYDEKVMASIAKAKSFCVAR